MSKTPSEPLPSQVAAREEVDAIYAKLGAYRNNPPDAVRDEAMRWLDELRPKAFPSGEKPTGPPQPAGSLAPVQLLHANGDFRVPTETTPSAAPRALSMREVLKLLGATDWYIEYGQRVPRRRR